MQMIMVLILISLSLMFTVLMLFSKSGTWHQVIFSSLATVLWFSSSTAVTAITKTFSYVYENSGEVIVEHGTRTVTVNWPMAQLFYGFALLSLLYVFVSNIEKVKEFLSRGRGGYGN